MDWWIEWCCLFPKWSLYHSIGIVNKNAVCALARQRVRDAVSSLAQKKVKRGLCFQISAIVVHLYYLLQFLYISTLLNTACSLFPCSAWVKVSSMLHCHNSHKNTEDYWLRLITCRHKVSAAVENICAHWNCTLFPVEKKKMQMCVSSQIRR